MDFFLNTRRHSLICHNPSCAVAIDSREDPPLTHSGMKMFTAGFTKTSARDFFGNLRRPGIKRLLDVRLNNVSQLAGFAKRGSV
jgi:hypothetical protein